MPHGLGSPGDFGQRPDFVDHGEPQGENLRRLEDLLEQEDPENLGPEADVEETAADEATDEGEDVALEPISVEELQSMILGAGQSKDPYTGVALYRDYYMAPEQLVVLVHHEIIDRDEARNYLRSQGIELFG